MHIGVVLPTAPRTSSLELSAAQQSFAEIRTFALAAEAAGLDSIWVLDHLLFRLGRGQDEGIWEAWTTLAALADATSRVRLGTLVLCTAFRNPAVVAKMAVTLDEVSQGRLILGIGAGWHLPELDAFGLPTTRLVDRFAVAAEIVTTLLRTGSSSAGGRHYVTDDARLLPLGPRPGAIPVLIGGEGPRMLGLVARYADAYNTAWYGWPGPRLDARLTAIRAACERIGRDPSNLDLTVGVMLGRQANLPADELVDVDHPGAIAELIEAYAARGIEHLIVALTPSTPDALAALADARATSAGLHATVP